MAISTRKGFKFSTYEAPEQSTFDKLFEIFQELITHTSGDFDEAIDWLRELDKEYELTTDDYTIDDFIEDLKAKGYIREEFEDGGGEMGEEGQDGKDGKGNGTISITAKMERIIRQRALDQIFGKLKRSGAGNHKTGKSGQGDEHTGDMREYRYGDGLENISMTESLKNAQINHGIGNFMLREEDLVVEDTQYKAQMSTVLMIDISHSMILYGEDRITPAKKVAMALAELITTRNTVAGLRLAMDMLRRKRNTNKQIFMITDGKPSCLRMPDGQYYKNSVGLDDFIVEKCYNMARQARKLHIPITTFMIAQDPYLMQFIRHFTEANKGKAFFTGLKGLGEMIFEDYENNRRKRLK